MAPVFWVPCNDLLRTGSRVGKPLQTVTTTMVGSEAVFVLQALPRFISGIAMKPHRPLSSIRPYKITGVWSGGSVCVLAAPHVGVSYALQWFLFQSGCHYLLI